MGAMGKIYFIAILVTVFTLEGWTGLAGIRPNVTVSPSNQRVRAKPTIQPNNVPFDLERTPIPQGMTPTLEVLSNELAILVNNLYKRRELDEVNVRSLMRIRLYLAWAYRQARNQKLRARTKEAVREITEELEHRLDFERRYKSGLITIPTGKTFASIETQTDEDMVVGESSTRLPDPIDKKSQPERARVVPPSPAPSAPPLSQMKNNRTVSRRDISQNIRNDKNQGLMESIIKTRGRRLAALLDKGLIDANQLTNDDRRLVEEYRSRGGSNPSEKDLEPLPVEWKIDTVENPPALQASIRPQARGDNSAFQRKVATQKNPSSKGSQRSTSSGDPLRADRILNSVGDQIDKRRRQIEAARGPDPRDQMQGATDAEWENS